MGKPTLKQVFIALERQILAGKTYLSISKGLLSLLDTESGVFVAAPTFFGLTAEGGLELAQMAIARLYDGTPSPVTIRMMLVKAEEEIDSFQNGNPSSVSEAVARSKAVVSGLEPALLAIKHRRDEWFAHLDARTVTNPQGLNAKAMLTVPDLDRAFEETENIL